MELWHSNMTAMEILRLIGADKALTIQQLANVDRIQIDKFGKWPLEVIVRVIQPGNVLESLSLHLTPEGWK